MLQKNKKGAKQRLAKFNKNLSDKYQNKNEKIASAISKNWIMT
jgi:hypothetical protein